jgi:hypothetical protein
MVRADWTIVTAWQKLVLGVALCLPVPALAVSGLALPLPTAVYRVAIAIVEGTDGLTRAFTGEDQETRVLAARKETASPRRDSPRVVSNPRLASPTGPLRVGARRQARRVGAGAAVRLRSPRTTSSGDTARTPSAPVAETAPDTSARAEAAPATHTPAATTQPTQSRASSTETRAEPILPPAEVAPDHTPVPKPAASPSPPPPSPPASQPGLLDPVTKPLSTVQPVTDALQPVTKPLDPVLKNGLDGRLGDP